MLTGRDAAQTEPDSAQDGGERAEEEAVGAGLVSLPFGSTRSDVAGPRGCWALNKRMEPCGAARRGDGDYCNAHSGIGINSDPAKYSAIGTVRSAQVRSERATLRLLLGQTRLDTPRGQLKAKAFVHAEALAGRAINAALDPEADSLRAGSLALSIIKEAEPASQSQMELSVPLSTEGVDNLSLSELLSVAATHGLLPDGAPVAQVPVPQVPA